MNEVPSIAIVGGGIAGLSAAYRLATQQPACKVTVFEASAQIGGVLQTLHPNGFLVERSADSFLVTEALPWLGNLVGELGLGDQLIEPNNEHRQALILRGRRLVPVPPGFQLMAPTRLWPLLRSPALPFAARLRAACEPWIPAKRDDGDESLSQFIARRLGKQAFEYLAQPLVAGIYSADPDRLSAPAALPMYVEMERKYGSVRRGLQKTGAVHKSASGARYAKFKTLVPGMGALVEALRARLESLGVDLRTETNVTRVDRSAHGWDVSLHRQVDDADLSPTEFDRLIVATSASAAAKLLSGVDGPLSAALASIEYTNVAVVSLSVASQTLPRPLNAFGVVVPRREGRRMIAASFSSVKFPGRAPLGHELVRVFVGGALQPQLALLPVQELASLAQKELVSLLNLTGEPQVLDIACWTDASPQYNLGYLDLMATVNERVDSLSALSLAGSAYGGVGLPQCVESGFAAADSIT